jgi:dipeptide/tripeptide permease
MGLSFLSIGGAGVRPCSIPFGVDQFDPTTDEGKKGINSFFNWYYTSFTLVLLFAQTVVVYIQDSVSWVIGFGILTVCMFFSIILFFIGTKFYVHVEPEGIEAPFPALCKFLWRLIGSATAVQIQDNSHVDVELRSIKV